jgi:hypothetical protein
MWIVLITWIEGIKAVGPFKTYEEAAASYGEIRKITVAGRIRSCSRIDLTEDEAYERAGQYIQVVRLINPRK